jgi:heme-degrading monooxygenase HmoA
MAHHRVWLFRPPSAREGEFASAYSDDGPWAEIFSSGQGFLGTRLLKPAEPGGWWMTIDSWSDEDAFTAFQAKHAQAYEELDRTLAGVAGEERFVGAFND